MKIINFPFTGIIGQDKMKLALILNIIDPKIGGVLLTGQQGTGKSTIVRSLVDILPKISIRQGCKFNCDPNSNSDTDYLCEFCMEQKISEDAEKKIISKKKPLVNLPLGSTAEMLIGSLDIEKIIREGKKVVDPGLLAKAHRGILYVDEVNLLPDHLVDLLLDVSASRVNIIEREGISIKHPSDFILVGSMNPEEGELRPQISDRFGLEVEIDAVYDPKIRTEIAKRSIKYNDNPKSMYEKYIDEQKKLSERIIRAQKKLPSISIPHDFYNLVSELIIELGLKSHRADINLLRSARAYAAFTGADSISKEHLEIALDLVLKHRLKKYKDDIDSEFLGETFEEIWHKLQPNPESDPDDEEYKGFEYEHPEKQKMNIFKTSKKIQKKFQETDLNQENWDIPEVDGISRKKQQHRYSSFDLQNDENEMMGYKAGYNDDFKIAKISSKDLKNISEKVFNPLEIKDNSLKMDIAPLFNFLKRERKITSYEGSGKRIRLLTHQAGNHIYSRTPKGTPHSLDILSSIKSHYLYNSGYHNGSLNSIENVHTDMFPQYPITQQISYPKLAVNLNFDDVKEKIFEAHAPLSIYFIVDLSASMRKTLNQVIEIIKSVHSIGYSKKDKVAIISFQGNDVKIMQHPSVSLNIGLTQLKQTKATSNTPLASALDKTITMIDQEKVKGISIPVIVIMSDLGANVAKKNNQKRAQSNKDFEDIAVELGEFATKIGKRGINVIIMKPQKSFATRFLGVHPSSVKKIEKSFVKIGSKIFEFDAYNPQKAIKQLKNILKN